MPNPTNDPSTVNSDAALSEDALDQVTGGNMASDANLLGAGPHVALGDNGHAITAGALSAADLYAKHAVKP